MPAQQNDDLWFFLQNEAYRQRGEGYQVNWAFHRHAAKFNLGAPLARTADTSDLITFGGQTYGYQPFGQDTLFNRIPDWRQIQSLNQSLNGQIHAPTTLERQLLEATWRLALRGSSTPLKGTRQLHPGWAFHQVSVQLKLGPAMGGNYVITLPSGAQYAIQVFAGDTLYSAGPPFTQTHRLSQLATDDPLFIPLWRETYRPCGASYNEQSPFHRYMVEKNLHLGTPLSGFYQSFFQVAPIAIQVFALDTLYLGPLGVVSRLSELPQPAVVHNWVPEPVAPPPVGGMVSNWLAAHPNAPAPVRALIEQALRMLGMDADVFALLTPAQQAQMAGSTDIVCADVVTLCLKAAGLPLDWTVTEPLGTQYTGNRAANYYRPSAQNPRLREVQSHEAWLPGDILIYNADALGYGEYHHVNIYVGDFSGTDVSNQTWQGRDVVNGSKQSAWNTGLTHQWCVNNHFQAAGFRMFRRVRHLTLEQIYRDAGF